MKAVMLIKLRIFYFESAVFVNSPVAGNIDSFNSGFSDSEGGKYENDCRLCY
jgi:hypothetical protein